MVSIRVVQRVNTKVSVYLNVTGRLIPDVVWLWLNAVMNDLKEHKLCTEMNVVIYFKGGIIFFSFVQYSHAII